MFEAFDYSDGKVTPKENENQMQVKKMSVVGCVLVGKEVPVKSLSCGTIARTP